MLYKNRDATKFQNEVILCIIFNLFRRKTNALQLEEDFDIYLDIFLTDERITFAFKYVFTKKGDVLAPKNAPFPPLFHCVCKEIHKSV